MLTISEYIDQPDAALVTSANFAATTISALPSAYGLTAGNATAIANSATALQTAFDDWAAAKSAYDAAVKTKASARAAFGSVFTAYLTQSYGTQTVQESAFAAIGLAGRPVRQVRPVRQPLNLVVTPNTNGFIVAKWKRNENTSTAAFVLEELQADGSWEVIWVGNRIRVELNGYTPGVAATFRVYATKGGETSQPSNNYTIYDEGSSSLIGLAA